MKRHTLTITLTEKQADLLHALIDSYQNGEEQCGAGLGIYAGVTRFAEVLINKLDKEMERVARVKRTEAQLAKFRQYLKSDRKEKP